MLAPIIGKEKTETYFLNRFVEMCTHNANLVRKCCAESIPVFCQVMGTQITENQLVSFLFLIQFCFIFNFDNFKSFVIFLASYIC